MDIRNFFGKPQAASSRSSGGAKKSKTPTKKTKKEPAKKKKSVVADDDDDSDATTDMNPDERKVEAKKRVEIDASTFFANSTKKPVAKRKDPAPTKKRAPSSTKKPKHNIIISIVDDDDEDDKTDIDEPTTRKKGAMKEKIEVVNLSNDNDDDADAVAKPVAKPKKKVEVVNLSDNSDPVLAPTTKRRTPVNEDDSDDDVDEPPKKRKVPTSRSRTTRTSRSADENEMDFDFEEINKKKKIDESDDKEDVFVEEKTPPAKKKAKTNPSPKKATTPAKKKTPVKKAPVKKEPLLEPSLTLESFDTDKATPECLQGLTFVFSGVLENLGREESIDYVKILGGRVTTAVSGKTSYLVVGEVLEDGRNYTEGSKFKKAAEMNIQMITGEKALYGLCKLFSDRAKLRLGDSTTIIPAKQPNVVKKEESKAGAAASNPYAKYTGGVVKNPYASVKKNPYAKSKPVAAAANSGNPYARAPSNEPVVSSAASNDRNDLWADKYAPASTREILGNQDSVKKLTTWLNRWEHTFNNDTAHGKAFSSPGGPWRAALLSGPPGIGKTTTATLVAKEAGRDVMEMNASDARSKKALTVGLGDVTGSQVINFGAIDGCKKKNSALRRCLIMDEVDGMGAGDRSGMAELIKLIKSTKVPIICICNERQSQKMRSLVPYCMDLRYKRPVKSIIARRAIRVGEQEGMKIEQNAAEAIAESCGNDIRQVLNCLQMWASSKEVGSSVTYKDLKKRESSINKDEILRVSMFDATKLIIEGRKGLAGADAKTVKNSLYRRSDAYFVDYSLMGLNVHQNYLKVMTRGYQEAVRDKDDHKMETFTDRMHAATMAMSDYAVGEQMVRGGDQNWSLLPFVSMMAVKTGYHGGGENGGFLAGFPEFAGWMGKNSSRGKKIRLLNEFRHHMNYKVSTDKADLRLHYLPLIRERLMELLADGDKAKVTEAIELMDEYGLDRDDVFENMDEFKIDSKSKAFGDLDSKQKSAFTREYNKGIHKSQALVNEQGAGKAAKKSKARKEIDPSDVGAVDDDGVIDSEEDEDEDLSEEKLRQLFGKKSAKKGKAVGTKKATGKRKSK